MDDRTSHDVLHSGGFPARCCGRARDELAFDKVENMVVANSGLVKRFLFYYVRKTPTFVEGRVKSSCGFFGPGIFVSCFTKRELCVVVRMRGWKFSREQRRRQSCFSMQHLISMLYSKYI